MTRLRFSEIILPSEKGGEKLRRDIRTLGPARASVLACAIIAAQPAAAGQLRFYSASDDQAAEEIAAGLKAAREAHIAALDRHDANLALAMIRERELVARRELAQRDTDVARYLSKSSAEARTDLTEIMRYRLGALLGADPNAQGFSAKLRRVRLNRDELDEVLGERDRLVALERARGLDGGTCSSDGSVAATLTENMRAVCQDVASQYDRLQRRVACRDEAAVALVAVARLTGCREEDGNVRPIAPKGDIGEAANAAAQASAAKEAQQALVTATKDRLKVLSCYLKAEQRPKNGETIRSAAEKLDGLLSSVERLWAAPEPETTRGEGTALVDAVATATPAVAPDPDGCNLPKDDASRLDKVRKTLPPALEALAGFKPLRPILADVRAEVESFRASKLGELLKAAANTSADQSGNDARVVAALARSEAPVSTLISVAQGTAPDTSGVLVELAEARMRASVAEVEAKRLSELERLLKLRARALTQESTALLSGVEAAAAAPDSRLLLAYGDSFSQGRVPAAVLERDAQNLELTAWSRRERAAVEAAYGALDAVAAEIRVSGKGGIRPADIAAFLNAAGLAAIAGTNR